MFHQVATVARESLNQNNNREWQRPFKGPIPNLAFELDVGGGLARGAGLSRVTHHQIGRRSRRENRYQSNRGSPRILTGIFSNCEVLSFIILVELKQEDCSQLVDYVGLGQS